MKKPSKAILTKAGEILQNPRSREVKETWAARKLAQARWSKKRK